MTAPDFLDEPPRCATATDYDMKHLKLYVRLLDAEADGADWREAVAILFGIDPRDDPERAMIPSVPGTSTTVISCARDG